MQSSEASLEGGFGDPPRDAAHVFRAAMSAMARPGRIERIAGAAGPAPLSAAASCLILTLCDPDTPLHLAPSHDTDAVRAWIAFHAGAPLVSASRAAFVLGRWPDLPLEDLPAGTPAYPDRSATLIAEVDRLEPEGTTLSGPGIRHQAALSVPDPRFFQRNARLFPLGLDAFLTCGDRFAALPRTTKVDA